MAKGEFDRASVRDTGGKLVCLVRESAEARRLWSLPERLPAMAAAKRLVDGVSDDPAGDAREFASWVVPWVMAVANESASFWCDGLRLPDDFLSTLSSLPENQQKSAIAGAEAVARSIAARCPDLERVIENAEDRRESGRMHAEEMSAGLARKTRARREWIRAKFSEVRSMYAAGDDGDRFARRRIAATYKRKFGSPISDKTIARHLREK